MRGSPPRPGRPETLRGRSGPEPNPRASPPAALGRPRRARPARGRSLRLTGSRGGGGGRRSPRLSPHEAVQLQTSKSGAAECAPLPAVSCRPFGPLHGSSLCTERRPAQGQTPTPSRPGTDPRPAARAAQRPRPARLPGGTCSVCGVHLGAGFAALATFLTPGTVSQWTARRLGDPRGAQGRELMTSALDCLLTG